MGFLDRFSSVPGHPARSVGLGRLAAVGDEPALVKIDGIPRPISGPVPDQTTFRKVRIPTGKRGTDATLAEMAKLSIEAAEDPFFIEYFRGVVRDCPERDHECVAGTLLRWAADNIKYVYDPRFCEYVQSPGYTAFVSGAGDCDDLGNFLVATFLVNGLAGAFKAVGTEGPDEFSHVFAEVDLPGRGWTAADAVMKPVRLGQEPPESAYKMRPNFFEVSP